MSDKIKETFYARFCGTPEEYVLGALEFVCSEADRLEAENAKLEEQLDSLSHIDNDATNLEEAKQYAQDWLVSFVANACGLKSGVRK